MNVLIPSTVAYGSATLTLTNSLGTVTANVSVGAIAPGLFTVDPAATMPAAQVVTTVNGAFKPISPVANCCRFRMHARTHRPQPADALLSDPLRHWNPRSRQSPELLGRYRWRPGEHVQYSGPQGGYPGLDQVNILIPSSLTGQGQVGLSFAIFTTSANTVLLDFQ